MEEHKPYVPDITSHKDITLKAVIVGAIFGIIFGSANAYLGLRVGLTISTAIPLAVISVAVFKALSPLIGKSTILDCNISQTTGSASSSLASGIIFTIPALFLWGFSPDIFKIGILALLGGVLGVLFMIPLRKYLIVKEHGVLPYPEGTAAAQVLIASEEGGAKAKNVFLGLGIGFIFKSVAKFLHLWSEKIYLKIPVLKKALLGMEPTPALLGVGYILGPRIAGIMVAGGLLSWIGIIPLISYFGEFITIPLFPETVKTIADMTPGEIWYKYIRVVGAGAVAVGGIITVIKSLPTMYSSLKTSIKEAGLGRKVLLGKRRTQTDLPATILLGGILLVTIIIIISPRILGIHTTLMTRVIASLCIVIFAYIFVTVSSRIVGMVGVTSNPTSGMTIVTLLGTSLIFLALGWTDTLGMATAITVGTVVCVGASIAGDISQDLKAGYIIGATPQKQQTSELIGVLTAAFAIAAAVWLLGKAFTFGSLEIPAPQATLMKTVIEGVLGGNLPWSLVLIGGAFALLAEILGIPSLPFAVGIYLPLSTMTPIYVGGLIRHLVEKKAGDDRELKSRRREKGVLLGSGLIAGEGIAGVGVAIYAYITSGVPRGIGIVYPDSAGDFLALAAFAVLAGFLIYTTVKEKGKK
ncbi:MAG: OPT family oligopeptide transporter [Candidatus Aminicenantales bacterium]